MPPARRIIIISAHSTQLYKAGKEGGRAEVSFFFVPDTSGLYHDNPQAHPRPYHRESWLLC